MTRATDQDLPTMNDEVCSQDTLSVRFVNDLQESKRIGIQRYGTALQPFNKRDSMRDAYEELVDLAVYLENLRREREELISLLKESRTHAKLTQNLNLHRKIGVALLGMGLNLND